MRNLVAIQRYFVRKLKNVEAESWVQKPEDAYVPFQHKNLEHLNIQFYKDVKNDLQTQVLPEQIQPVSPKMGPYRVENPKIHDKMYRWCSCGLSTTQPFCNGNHQGTAFKPHKFTVEEKVKELNLCGCKLTTQKPFCDGRSCKGQQSD